MVTWGPQIDEQGIYVWFRPTWEIEQSKSMAGKVRYTFLGGPDKGKSGMVKSVRMQVCPADQAKRELCYIEFDQPVTPAQANQLGVLLEYDQPDHGSMGHGSEHNWNSPENSVHSAMCRRAASARPRSAAARRKKCTTTMPAPGVRWTSRTAPGMSACG